MRHRHYNWDIHLLSPDWGKLIRLSVLARKNAISIKAVTPTFLLEESP